MRVLGAHCVTDVVKDMSRAGGRLFIRGVKTVGAIRQGRQRY